MCKSYREFNCHKPNYQPSQKLNPTSQFLDKKHTNLKLCPLYLISPSENTRPTILNVNFRRNMSILITKQTNMIYQMAKIRTDTQTSKRNAADLNRGWSSDLTITVTRLFCLQRLCGSHRSFLLNRGGISSLNSKASVRCS